MMTVALMLCRPGGTRTLDPLIKSQLLCQLSYGPDNGCKYNLKKDFATNLKFLLSGIMSD